MVKAISGKSIVTLPTVGYDGGFFIHMFVNQREKGSSISFVVRAYIDSIFFGV
jgi:hypothetical protein